LAAGLGFSSSLLLSSSPAAPRAFQRLLAVDSALDAALPLSGLRGGRRGGDRGRKRGRMW
jgi:hypothetical protein